MRWTLFALAAALAASASPAAACGFFDCPVYVLRDDAYPLGNKPLRQPLRSIVAARFGAGMALAGFYNDPALALAAPAYAPPDFGYAPPPEPAYVEAAPPPVYGAPVVGYGVHRPYYGAHPYARHGAAQYGQRPHVY